MEGRIRQLESILEHAEIIEAPRAAASSARARSSRSSTRATATTTPSATSSATSRSSTGDLDVISPTAPLGAALIGAPRRRHVAYEAPNGASCASASSRWRRPDRAPADATDAELAPLDDARRARRSRAAAAAGPRRRAAGRHGPPARAAGPARRADGRAAARLDGHRRPQLLHAATSRSASTSASLAFDHRGHGRGIRIAAAVPARGLRRRRRRRCADVLGIERFIAVGYSMGGAVAQLVWRRHPDARARARAGAPRPAHFNARRNERLSFLGLAGLAALARLTPAQARRWLTDAALPRSARPATWEPWAVERGGRARLADGPRGRPGARRVPLRRLARRDRRADVGRSSRCSDDVVPGAPPDPAVRGDPAAPGVPRRRRPRRRRRPPDRVRARCSLDAVRRASPAA